MLTKIVFAVIIVGLFAIILGTPAKSSCDGFVSDGNCVPFRNYEQKAIYDAN